MDRFWIKLFKTPFGYYLYEAKTNEILSISKTTYDEIECHMNDASYIMKSKEGIILPHFHLQNLNI